MVMRICLFNKYLSNFMLGYILCVSLGNIWGGQNNYMLGSNNILKKKNIS